MQKIPINSIKPNPNNPRLIKDGKFKSLVKSIKDFPEMMAKRPMVCVTDADGKLFPLGGNMRLKAIQEIGYKEIPAEWVILADEWTEERRREFVIKDNVGFGEWDWDVIANEWDADLIADWGLDVPDFKDENPQDLSDKVRAEYKIEIVCKSEQEQERAYNFLIEKGYECRLLTL